MHSLIHYYYSNLEFTFWGIAEWVIYGALASIIIWLRRVISSTLLGLWRIIRRIYKKNLRFRLSQCFPAHTLEYIRLIRQSRELALYKQKEKKQREELEENITTLLIWASKFRYFSKDDALNAMDWRRSYTHMIFGLANKRELIKVIDNQRGVFAITTEGRELLFRKDLLHSSD